MAEGVTGEAPGRALPLRKNPHLCEAQAAQAGVSKRHKRPQILARTQLSFDAEFTLDSAHKTADSGLLRVEKLRV